MWIKMIKFQKITFRTKSHEGFIVLRIFIIRSNSFGVNTGTNVHQSLAQGN